MQGPQQQFENLMAGNALYSVQKGASLAAYQKGQTPFATLVKCCDSRVPTSVFNMDTTNNLFVIETIGNQVSTAEGSVDYGVLHLHTPLLIILGHSDCGAVKASLDDYTGETSGIKRELDTLQGPVKATADIDDLEKRKYMCIQGNVDQQVAYCLQKYKTLVDEGKLTIIGAFFDFHKKLSEEMGRIHVMNVNGKRTPEDVTKLGFSKYFKRL